MDVHPVALRLLPLLGSLSMAGCVEAPPHEFDPSTSGGGAANMAGAAGMNTAGSGVLPSPNGGAGGTAGTIGNGGTTGNAGAAGMTGTAGTAGTNGAAGSAGTAGSGPTGMYDVPRGMSAGCGMDAPDEPEKYIKHDVAVTGVDPTFIQEHPSNPGNNGGYTYANRNYFIRLPAGYDKTKPYALTFGGGGCGNTSGDSGKGGGKQASGIESIKVGLSYVYSGGACFEDGYANTPEVPYFDAVLADISAKYCINLEKVFIGGYSSGAWESVTLGLARGGKIRGIATGAGGLRKERPMPSGIPIAAVLLTGQGDGANPIDGETGSAKARDQILMTNGCVGTATMPFTASDQNCVQYMGCPAAFPVIWCTPPGGHTEGSGMHWEAVGKLWDMLPPVP